MNTEEAGSILRLAQLLIILGLSKSTVYAKLAVGSSHDPTFPRPVRLGKRAVGWIASDVFAWLAARPQA